MKILVSFALVATALTGCNSQGACVYKQSSGTEVCVETGRRDCSKDAYKGEWHAFDHGGSDPRSKLTATCKSLGYEHWYGSGFKKAAAPR